MRFDLKECDPQPKKCYWNGRLETCKIQVNRGYLMIMNKPCYCCDNSRVDPGTKENFTDLDRALNELGMLSVTTESRKQYLQEIVKQDQDESLHVTDSNVKALQGGFCVFHMNKNFVTNLVSSSSFSKWKNDVHSATSNKNTSLKIRYHQKYPCHHEANYMLKMKSTRRRTRLLKPYQLPWHHKLYQERTRTVSWNQENETASTDETTCSSTSSSSSTGNRSNPGSPSKTGRPASGNGLIRSRSLDDLNCPAWDNEETQSQPLVQCREEIENVSQQMRHLTVT